MSGKEDWWSRAACLGLDPDLFVPTGTEKVPPEVSPICARCRGTGGMPQLCAIRLGPVGHLGGHDLPRASEAPEGPATGQLTRRSAT